MFSGIIETIGTITQIQIVQGCKVFTIKPEMIFTDLKIGDSVSINGVCLTITHILEHAFQVSAVPETLRLSNLDRVVMNDVINIERALQIGDRLGGHFVQGHVDGVGEILSIQPDASQALIVKISLPTRLAKYVVNKGYITIDGMSITVIDATPEWFTVSFIPHTQAVTIIRQYIKHTFVNLEVDIIGKYIENIIGSHAHANIH